MTRYPRPLLTPWGETLDRDNPLPEYPRPQLRRASYVTLNGRWDYAFRISDEAPARWDGQIVVPFSPESLLSGVNRRLQPGEFLHYRRHFTAPQGERVILHFGAVDQWCRVLVNGRNVIEHGGGYLPFSVDITEALTQGDNLLHVVVTDPSDSGQGSRGKQKRDRGGIWYTPQSGIWQTVWLEAVPDVHITSLKIEPDLTGAYLTTTTSAPTEVTITISRHDEVLASTTAPSGHRCRVDIPDPHLWSPEDPALYDVHIVAGEDAVDSYLGLRTFGTGTDAEGHPRLLLNGKPYFHAGVLDQGYWPDGLYTAPSDDAMIFDIASMKDLGFTMLRKHIKIEPLRWYYHCDRLGMLVWQDAVNGGGQYRSSVVQIPAVLPLRLPDCWYPLFGRADAAARTAWLHELEAMIEVLRNTVSIAVWVPFNEGWGQFDAARTAMSVRRQDPSRSVDHASGWHDQGSGDIRSLHVYFRPFRTPRRHDRRVLALTEYGGYSQHIAEHSVNDVAFGYRRYSTAQELTDAFRRLHVNQIAPAIARGLAATVYTQLSDVEDETNGLLTYDRRVCKMPAHEIRELITQLRL